MKAEDREMEEAIERLTGILKAGDTVYTILRHVSRSGMLRAISPILIREGEPLDLTHYVAKALGLKIDRNNYGVKVGGCGMDMGFHLVYNLSRTIFPNGFKTWEGYWRNEPSDFDSDGGYALKQKWL